MNLYCKLRKLIAHDESLHSSGNESDIYNRTRRYNYILISIILILFSSCLTYLHSFWKIEFPKSGFHNLALSSCIKNNFGYNDVLIRFNGVSISTFPPFQIASSRKQIYKFFTKEDFEKFYAELPSDATLNIVIPASNPYFSGYKNAYLVDNSYWAVVKNISLKDLNFEECNHYQ